ncbi:hypothetical protein Patl1_25989 [Pistacia atlantica]|uniref:Uncharacterized protein n=1 Tax=Pistacia atlantica TaxID=434234 RepID=A0ACC1B2L3_9ROSI|nr:hypothetical protein Patl1_25989 [Pistacia atlantica]
MGNDSLTKVIGIGDAVLMMRAIAILLVIASGSSLRVPWLWLKARSFPLYTYYKQDFLKAFVHIPKDERSKFDMKTRQCIFIGYGLDEFCYKLYDPVEKKLVRSSNVVFIDQTIQDVEKTDKVVPQYSDGLIDLDLVPFIDLLTNIEHDVQDDQ